MLNGSRSPVRIPASQLRPEGVVGEPFTVGHSGLGFMVPLQWFDENGDAHNDVFFVAGGVVYKSKDSEEWAADLGQVKAKLADEVKRRFTKQFKDLIKEVVLEITQGGRPITSDSDVDVFDSAACEVADEVAPTG